MTRSQPSVPEGGAARVEQACQVPLTGHDVSPVRDAHTQQGDQFVQAIASLATHDHACLIYNSDAEQQETLVPFIKEGLARGERCVYIADEDNGRKILTALQAAGVDAADAESRGGLVVLSQRDAYLRDGAFDPDRMIAMLAESTTIALRDGFSALRVIGEMTWALEGLPDISALLEYEAKLNGFFPVHACLAICQYDRRRFSAEVIRDVIRTHPVVISGHMVCRNPFYVPPREFLSSESAEREVERLLQQLVDRERVQTALNESRSWLAAILDNAPLAMVVVDESGRVCHANGAAAALADQPAEQMVGSLMGNALKCLNALSNPKGCGSTAACYSCDVRKAVESTYTKGVVHHDFRARIPLERRAGMEHTDVVVSATPLNLSGKRMVLVSIDDVSDTVRAETSLKAFLDALPESALLTTADGNVIEANDEVARRLGMSPEELQGRSVFGALPEAVRDTRRKEMTRVALSGEATRFVDWRNGRCIDNVVAPVRSPDGTIDRLAILGLDVTERIRAEEALRRSEREKALILGSTVELFAMYDRELCVQWANKAFCDAVGVEEDQVIGQHCYGLLEGNRTPCPGCPVKLAIETGESHECEHVTPNGSVWFLRGRPVFDEAGAVVGAVEFAQDITERRRSEEELRRNEELLDEMGRIARIGGWEHNLVTGEARWTRGTYEIAEIEPGEPIPGPDEHLGFYPEEDREVLRQAYLRAVETGDPFDLELQCNTAKGNTIRVRVIGKAGFEDGKCVRLRGTIQDITERKHAEAALRESEERMNLALRGAELGAWDWNLETGEVAFDDRWAEILGYSRDELKPHVSEWETRVHADDLPRVKEALDAHIEGKTESYESEYRLRHKSGDWVWILDKGRATERDTEGRAIRACGTHLDVTQRKQSEKALNEALLWLESAIKAGNVGLWDWDLKTDEVAYSAEWKRQIGYTEDEIGRGLHEWESRVHPDDLEATLKYARRCIAEARPQYEMHFRFRHKDGSYRWILAQAALILDEQGRPVRAMGTHVDITEQRRSQEALQQSEAMYRTLVMGLPDIVKRFDRDGRHLFASENVAQRAGLTAEQCIGKTHRELGAPDPLCGRLEAAIRETFDSGVPCETEIEADGEDGATIYNWRLIPERDSEGRVQSVLSISRDITEHRRVQREYHTLFNQMLNGFALHEIVCDDEGRPVDYRFLAVNPAFEKMTGLRAADIIGKTVLEVMPSTEKSWIETYGRVALTGKPVRFGNYSEELDKNFDVTAFQPAPNQFACIFEDVSDLRRAEAERSELEVQLRQSQKLEAMGQLASGVAHDFNNLLTAITGYAELLRQSIPEGTTAEQAVDGIDEATRQAAGVTRSLLTFSSKMHTKKKRVDLRTIVEKTALLLRRMMPASVSIETDPPQSPAVWLSADENQLQQIIMNLALNARDAMPDGGVLRFSVVESHPADSRPSSDSAQVGATVGKAVAQLIVSDTGTGMTPEALKRVFEPFFTTKARGQGTGLGMAIVHGIVAEHGGNVEIETLQGEGTKLIVSLPISAAEVADRQEARLEAPVRAQGELVLLAEDNWNVRSIVGTVLNNCGFRVMAASDGGSFAEGFQAQCEEIQLLILDVDLPKRSGLDCLREIRANGSDVPAIVITGGGDARVEEELDEHTVLLRKPFGMPELQRLAMGLVSRRNMREE